MTSRREFLQGLGAVLATAHLVPMGRPYNPPYRGDLMWRIRRADGTVLHIHGDEVQRVDSPVHVHYVTESDGLDASDMSDGKYDFAEVWVSEVGPPDRPLLRGRLGELKRTSDDGWRADLHGMKETTR